MTDKQIEAVTRLPFDECQTLAAQLERGRKTGSRWKHDLTHEQILRFAARKGFHVSRQYRQDALREKAHTLKKLRLLSGGREQRFGDGHTYRATPAGICVLGIMEKMGKSND